MKVGNIWKSTEWTIDATAETVDVEKWVFEVPQREDYATDKEFNIAYSAYEANKTNFSQVSGDTRIAYLWYTTFETDPVDAVMLLQGETVPHPYELKGLHASSTEDRYQTSTLFEETKRIGELETLADKMADPVFVRYYYTDHKKIGFRLKNIDWANTGRNRSCLATAVSSEDRDKKSSKDIWFLPNNKAMKGGIIEWSA